MKEKLKKAIALAAGKITGLKIKKDDVLLEHPSEEKFGDYACNIAMTMFSKIKAESTSDGGRIRRMAEKDSSEVKQAGKPILSDTPLTLAQSIVNQLKLKLPIAFTVEPPGFINISIKNKYLIKEMLRALKKGERFGQNPSLKGKKIMVEYAHPNTHKPFHIGHLRNIITGEAIARILSSNGALIIRANYQGDVGLHIAKCLWALRKSPEFALSFAGKDIKANFRNLQILAKAYVQGNKAYKNNKKAALEIKDINLLVYASAQKYQQKQGNDTGKTNYLKLVKNKKIPFQEIYQLWLKTRQWSLDYFQGIYKRLGVKYDRLYFESECLAGIDEAYQALKKGVLKESKGAIVFAGETYGLDTRVFVNSLGLPTYEGKELALAKKEFSEFGKLDKAIHVVAPEQTSFFKVTFKVEELLGIQHGQQKHLAYGWVRLKKGKMSSRLGNVVLGEWLLNEAKKGILKIMKKNKFNLLDTRSWGKKIKKEINETVEIIGTGAVKYSFLKQGIGKDIAFDFNESISLSGNSGPYLQYTYARCQSVLRKAGQLGKILGFKNIKNNPQELSVLRWLYYFPETVYQAGKELNPSLICQYLYELAQKYNAFYNKHQILEEQRAKSKNSKSLSGFRLLLTSAVAQTLKNGLYLLGIKTIEKM